MGAEYAPSSCEFRDIPQQWGFTLDDLLQGDFGNQGVRQGLSFLQTWLFFGLLQETLGSQQRIVPQEWIAQYDWTAEYASTQVRRRYLMSPKLRSYLMMIEHRLTDPRQNRPSWQYWEEVLGLTMAVAEAFDQVFAQYCTTADVEQQVPLQITWSILMLGQILTHTIMKCYRVETTDMKHWPDGAILHLRVSERFECPHLGNKLMALFAMDVVYPLTLLSFPESVGRFALLPQNTPEVLLPFLSLHDADPAVGRGRHRNCTIQRCLGEKVDQSSYRTAHVHGECDCPFLGPNVQEVVQILDDEQIPAFVVRKRASSKSGHGLFIDVVRAKDTSGYAAISHVWADGLGNPSSNQLPTCQILRLARLVCALTGREAQPFWIDTFGIPRNLEQRKKALAVMEQTYRLAEKVLVLDGALQQTPMYRNIENELAGVEAEAAGETRTGVALELLLRIVCCAWTSRLWTLPEGMLGPELHFQFLEGTVELGDLVAQLRTWRLVGTNIIDDIISFLIRLRPKIRTQSRRGLEPLDPLMSRWPSGDQYGQFVTMFGALEFRDTSWKEDEATCLGIHLNLDMKAILSRDDPERLEALFAQLDQIPGDLIFTHGERIPRYPYRWAPLHLLEYKDNYVCIPAATPQTPIGLRTDRGLLVQLDCFRLWTKNEMVPDTAIIFFSLQATSEDGVEFPVSYGMQIAALDIRESPSWRQSNVHRILRADGVGAECLYLLVGPRGVPGPLGNFEPGHVGLIVQRLGEEDDCIYGTPLDTVVFFKMPGSRTIRPDRVNDDTFAHWHAEKMVGNSFCVG
jgi:hypothetical protein